jgi:hypothetical protein
MLGAGLKAEGLFLQGEKKRFAKFKEVKTIWSWVVIAQKELFCQL